MTMSLRELLEKIERIKELEFKKAHEQPPHWSEMDEWELNHLYSTYLETPDENDY